MIKKYNKFVKESIGIKGKGPGNDDLIPSAPKKQSINPAIPSMDFLRVGKHILTNNIDGFIDSIQNKNVFIIDRLTQEIKKYTFKEIIREITRFKGEKENPSIVQGFEGTPAWAVKQKIYEQKYETEQELEFGTEEEDYFNEEDDDFNPMDIYGEDKYDIPVEDTISFQNQSAAEQSKLLYGTEDNPLGLPNKGIPAEMKNEKWITYWDKFNKKQIKLVRESIEDEEEEEDEVKIVRGTEDNPLPDKSITKIESYE